MRDLRQARPIIPEKLWRLFDRYAERFTRYAVDHEGTPLQGFQAAADLWAFIQRHRKGSEVSCLGKGCNGCCRGEVSVAPEEVDQIMPHLTAAIIDRIRKYDDANSKTTRCPMLGDDGGCEIYDVRPTVCRIYMVVSPVDHCYPERSGKQTTLIVADQDIQQIHDQLREADTVMVKEIKQRLGLTR